MRTRLGHHVARTPEAAFDATLGSHEQVFAGWIEAKERRRYARGKANDLAPVRRLPDARRPVERRCRDERTVAGRRHAHDPGLVTKLRARRASVRVEQHDGIVERDRDVRP